MESLNKFNVSSTYIPLDGGETVVLNLKTSTSQSLQTSQKFVLIAIDVSGSMSGSPIEAAKKVICDMITYMHEELKNDNIGFIQFNTKCFYYSLKGKPTQRCIEGVTKVVAGGGTQFVPVFDEIEKLLTTTPIDDFCVVFLSDGQAEKINVLKPKIESLKATMAKYTSNSEFHTIGFSSDHDAVLLSEMTRACTGQGTFQYVKSSSEIKECMEAITGFLGEKRIGAEIYDPVNNSTQRVHFQAENAGDLFEDSKFRGMVFFDQTLEGFLKLKDSLILKIRSGTLEESHTLKPTLGEIENPADKVKFSLTNIQNNLRKLSQRVSNKQIKKEEVEVLDKQLNEYRKIVENNTKDIFRLKIAEREPLFVTVEEITNLLNTFNDLIKTNFINQISNEQIAMLNSMAYRDVTRQGLLKKLDKNAKKAVPILNEAFKKVKEIADALDVEALNKKYEGQIEEYGACILTCYNFVEALKAEDCLCITFDMTRSQTAIADATRVHVRKIFPTIISATSFLDSVKYAIRLNPKASGGFTEDAEGQILTGVSHEKITGALPIYICPEHWQVATLLMKPLLGWNITLDPVGYNYYQKKVLPFMLTGLALEEYIKNPKSHFNSKLRTILMDTCVAIIRDDMEPDFGGTFKEDVTKVYEGYLSDGALRTIEYVGNNSLLLAHIYVFSSMGLIEKPSLQKLNEMVVCMIEEDLRRRQEDWNADIIKDKLRETLNVNLAKYVPIAEEKLNELNGGAPKKVIQTFDASERLEAEYELLYLEALENEGLATPQDKARRKSLEQAMGSAQKEETPTPTTKADEEVKTNKTETKTDTREAEAEVKNSLKISEDEIISAKTLKDMTGVQAKALEEYTQLLKEVAGDIARWIKIFYPEADVDLKKYETFEYLGIQTPLQFLCLYVQNRVHAKNADRKAAFTSKRYKSPFIESEASEYLLNTYKNLVLDSAKKKAAHGKKKASTATGGVIDMFCKTDNLAAAAGFLVKGIGLGDFQHIQSTFRRENEECSFALEKLMMIKRKEYKGVSLNVDFVIRKRFMRKVFKKYLVSYSYNQWKELWFV